MTKEVSRTECQGNFEVMASEVLHRELRHWREWGCVLSVGWIFNCDYKGAIRPRRGTWLHWFFASYIMKSFILMQLKDKKMSSEKLLLGWFHVPSSLTPILSKRLGLFRISFVSASISRIVFIFFPLFLWGKCLQRAQIAAVIGLLTWHFVRLLQRWLSRAGFRSSSAGS